MLGNLSLAVSLCHLQGKTHPNGKGFKVQMSLILSYTVSNVLTLKHGKIHHRVNYKAVFGSEN